MSTLADELLQDFEDSGSEGGEEPQDGSLFPDEEEAKTGLNGDATGASGSMELDGDEEEVDDDEQMAGMNVDAEEDEETTKIKVEKLQLGGVEDVRSVAGLMKTLEPVLEVSTFLPQSSTQSTFGLHLSCVHSPDNKPGSTENRPFPVFPSREADHLRWLDRRQS